jgi:hypothetical protein
MLLGVFVKLTHDSVHVCFIMFGRLFVNKHGTNENRDPYFPKKERVSAGAPMAVAAPHPAPISTHPHRPMLSFLGKRDPCFQFVALTQNKTIICRFE